MILATLKHISKLLAPTFKKKLPKVAIAFLLSSLIDVLGLAIVLPIVTVTLNTDLISTNFYFHKLYLYMRIIDIHYFLFSLYVILLIVFLFRAFAAYFMIRFLANFSYGIYENLSIKMYRNYLTKNHFFFQENNSAILIRNIKAVPLLFSRFVLLSILTIISEGFVLLFIVISIVYYDYKLFILLFVTILPFVVFFFQKIKQTIHVIGVEQNESDPKMYYAVACGIEGHIETKLLNKEEHFIKKYETELSAFNNLNVKLHLLQQIPPKLIEFAAILGIVLMMCYAIFFANSSVNIFVAMSIYIGAAYRILPSINKLLASFMLLKQHQFTLDILEPAKGKQQNFISSSISKMSFKNEIVFNNLAFQFNGSDFELSIENLKIQKGKTIGFVGKSGSGKTTLMNILLRFITENKGEILVDGQKITKENEKSWQKLIGYVKQDFFLMDATIAENIAFGEELNDIDNQKLNRCIEIASLSEFINGLPQKTNTVIGEKGTLLSGGQKQRIAIARAIYYGAEILIFDEATSALDSETEKEITNAIANIKNSQLTIFVIAHRYSSLKNCDEIYEMQNGKIIEKYTYNDLLKAKNEEF